MESGGRASKAMSRMLAPPESGRNVLTPHLRFEAERPPAKMEQSHVLLRHAHVAGPKRSALQIQMRAGQEWHAAGWRWRRVHVYPPPLGVLSGTALRRQGPRHSQPFARP